MVKSSKDTPKFRVRELAKEKGIDNPHQLMLEAKISQATSRILWNSNGNVYTTSLIKVANFLGVPIGELFAQPGEGENGGKEREGGTIEGNEHPVGRVPSWQSTSRSTGYLSTATLSGYYPY